MDTAILWERCSLRVWLLAIGNRTVSMPPTKVCPQCKATVPVRRKTCERRDQVLRSKRKAECNLQDYETYESSRIRVWNQLGKLKISCTRPVKEPQKLVSELCIGRNKQNAHSKHERVTRQWSISSQHTSTITCTPVPRVWHFSVFHFPLASVTKPILQGSQSCTINAKSTKWKINYVYKGTQTTTPIPSVWPGKVSIVIHYKNVTQYTVFILILRMIQSKARNCDSQNLLWI